MLLFPRSAFQATFSKHQTQTSSLCVKNFSMNHIKQEFRLADMETEKKLVRNKILEVSSWKKNRLSGENFLSKVQFRRNPSKNPSESFRRYSGQSDPGQQKAWMLIIKESFYWGRHSTEVAFALLSQQPWVWIPALPFLFTAKFVDSKRDRSHLVLIQEILQMQQRPELRITIRVLLLIIELIVSSHM